MRLATAALVFAAVAAAPMHGQVIQGRVSGSDGAVVPGAIVVLLDSAGVTRGTMLADERGAYRFVAPGAGRYQLRVDRVAFVSSTSEAFAVQRGETVERRLIILDAGRRIADVQVSSKARCELRPDAAAALLEVWDEARKALTSISLTEQARRYSMTLAMTERTFKADGKTLVSQRVTTRTGVANRPFIAPPAARLQQSGYVVRDGDYWTFHAPDAQVILSDEFLGSHCLQLRVARDEGDQPARVGLAFTPVSKKGKITDIEGTLWLNRASGELERLDYKYTRMPGGMDHASTGGRLDFRRLPSGAWIVQRWAIRMPMVATESRTVSQVAAESSERSQRFDERLVRVLAGVKEDGGEVTRVDLGGGKVWSSDAASLQGTVVDATTGRPLADAAVYLAGTGFLAVTSADGRFGFTDLPVGTYEVAFRHPRLDTLALPAPRQAVTLARHASDTVALAIPPVDVQLREACGDSVPVARRTLVRGLLRDRTSAAVLADATVRVSVLQQAEGVVQAAVGEGRTDAAGRFVLCGLPPLVPVTLEFEAGGHRTTRVVTPEAGRLVAVPVLLPDGS